MWAIDIRNPQGTFELVLFFPHINVGSTVIVIEGVDESAEIVGNSRMPGNSRLVLEDKIFKLWCVNFELRYSRTYSQSANRRDKIV